MSSSESAASRLPDTTRMGHPKLVLDLCTEARERWPDWELALHFHNTRGMGLANVLSGLAQGVQHYEACLADWAAVAVRPWATGNICPQDLVAHARVHGLYETGVNLDKLIAAAQSASGAIVSHDLPGRSSRPGKPPTCTRFGRPSLIRYGAAVSIKGRGAADNPQGRFETLARSREPEAEVQSRPETSGDAASGALDHRGATIHRTSRLRSSITPLSRGANTAVSTATRGPSHAYLGLSPGLEFETRLFARKTPADLLAQGAFASPVTAVS